MTDGEMLEIYRRAAAKLGPALVGDVAMHERLGFDTRNWLAKKVSKPVLYHTCMMRVIDGSSALKAEVPSALERENFTPKGFAGVLECVRKNSALSLKYFAERNGAAIVTGSFELGGVLFCDV